jgi:hypothetical protein
MKISTRIKENISLYAILLGMILYLSHCVYSVNHNISFKAVVVKKSIDTLSYGCGYKGRKTCTGIFNKVFYKSELGDFSDNINRCCYDTVKVGDTIVFSGNKVQLKLWYNIDWKYLKDK